MRHKFISGLAILVAAGAFASPAHAYVEVKRCATWNNPLGAEVKSSLTVDAIGGHTTCAAARSVGRAWLRTDGYFPKTLRTGNRKWRRISKDHGYWDGQFGATKMEPGYYWTMQYVAGKRSVHLEYDENEPA